MLNICNSFTKVIRFLLKDYLLILRREKMTRPLNTNHGKTTTKGPSTTDTKRGSNLKGAESKKGQNPGHKDSSLHSKGQGFSKPR
jgi:hypothetical protein